MQTPVTVPVRVDSEAPWVLPNRGIDRGRSRHLSDFCRCLHLLPGEESDGTPSFTDIGTADCRHDLPAFKQFDGTRGGQCAPER